MDDKETEAARRHVAEYNNLVHDALNRMARAAQRGTGCHLTADMIAALDCTVFGSMWSEPDPRQTS